MTATCDCPIPAPRILDHILGAEGDLPKRQAQTEQLRQIATMFAPSSADALATHSGFIIKQALSFASLLESLCARNGCANMILCDACPTHGTTALKVLWRDTANAAAVAGSDVELCGADYVARLVAWLHANSRDQHFGLWDSEAQRFFPADALRDRLRLLVRRLYRLFGHVYSVHLAEVERLGAAASVGTFFATVAIFALQQQLLSASELAPLLRIVNVLQQVSGAKAVLQ